MADHESKLAAWRRGTRGVQAALLFGDSDKRFVWRVLSDDEKQLCVADATKRLREIGIPLELRGFIDLESEITVQVLARAMRFADSPGADDSPYPYPLATRDELAQHLTRDERENLFTEYCDVEDRFNPQRGITDQEIAEIQSALKKNTETALNHFAPSTLRLFMLSMADRRSTSPTPSSSSS